MSTATPARVTAARALMNAASQAALLSLSSVAVRGDQRARRGTGTSAAGGALYARADWIGKHEKETQALTNAILATLKWIHSHTAEEIMAKMPEEFVGADKALYLAALKNSIPMYSTTGRMDPKGAEAVLAVFAQSSPDVAKAKIDLSKTYTNRFVEQASQKTGMQ
jgi:NitT/TauT family transport system substrate-binding protein